MTTSATARARTLWQQGVDFEDLLATLRAEGHSKLDSIGVTAALLRLPLSEAKRLVHFSSAWARDREAHERLHDLVEAVATSAAGSTAAEDDPQAIAQQLVGVVTAVRADDLATARQIVAELLESTDPERVVILSGALTAALAEMAQLGQENLLHALGVIVAGTAQAPEDTVPLERATAALSE